MLASLASTQQGICEGPVDVSSLKRCDLWGGMGEILECHATFSSLDTCSFVAKVISLPGVPATVSDRRKMEFNLVAQFYERGHAKRLCVDRPPGDGGRLTICMSKLREVPTRNLSDAQLRAVLTWLAKLHALYWGVQADEALTDGLQPQGCYWHLDTRLDELERWTDTEGFEGRLRRAARAIDKRLKADRHQTICHGDAKSKNMLFEEDGTASMYDFQYVGKASPGKDLAYCLICTRHELSPDCQATFLTHYLGELRPLLEARGDAAPSFDELQCCYFLSVCDLVR